MRSISLFISFIFALESGANNIGSVDTALQEMKLGHVEQSISILKKIAAVNDITAQFYLGNCYEYGIGMDVDLQSAFNMYRRAAERGFPSAMRELAKCYSQGIGVAQNQSRADEWMSRFYKRRDYSSIPNLVEIYAYAVEHADSTVAESDLSDTLIHNDKKTNVSNVNNGRYISVSWQETITTPGPVISNQPEMSISDVDIDIPKVSISNPNLFALIIANENYQDVAPVSHALSDGETLAKYCLNTLGIPQSNIHLVKDATLNNIKREINLIKKIADAYKGEASFIVYYAGHGIPDEKAHDSFLMPIDGFPADMTTCYSLNEFYSALSSIPSRKTVVMLDACFSGASREGGMLISARGVAIKPKSVRPSGNMLVISSATGDETAYPYKEKNHGLFTYFLLKKIKETHGNVNIGTLMDYVHQNVIKTSIVVNGKSQTPTITPSTELGDEWKNWKLN